ncbi:MAG: DoxX family protein [Bdellovibrionaceae bacterium]|nr:DoxX family protein [Pseudobdellovibrionaceae bacterium]
MNFIGILQIIVAIGLLNVWLIRGSRATGYRGSSALNLKQEFAIYGLPAWSYYLVGALKISAAIALVVGLWFSAVGLSGALLVALLMLGALAMHLKVKDPVKKSLPAFVMLALSLTICASLLLI